MEKTSRPSRRTTGIKACLAITSLLVVLATASAAIAASYEAIEIVPTRPDVTVRLLVIKANSKPSTALILFPGADGAKHFGEKDGRFWVSNNFLMRSSTGSCRCRVYRRGGGRPQ